MRLKLTIAISVSSFIAMLFPRFPSLKFENTLMKPLGKGTEEINDVILQILVQILVTK